MTSTAAISDQNLTLIASRLGYGNPRRYRLRAEHLFQGLNLRGARVLDVGCGPGAFTLWPALHGANVLAIEPEIDGATSGTLGRLQRTVTDSKLEERVETRAARLDEITAADGPFDIVVTYNVVNHLDEDAVQRLPGDAEAERRYHATFRHVADLMTPGGVLIVADCGRSNGWAKVGMRSPLARTIEWQKHLDPSDWLPLLTAAGFTYQDLRWSFLYPFRRVTANRLVQYLTSSHFVLRVRRA